ncbi:biotin/lipoyl-binding protein [Solimonas sp. K1W22B-7]|uniref:acetyl/propionyl/methylcrotonyl-CoA carboxylase subunit alpha n=1 Tax=Solimonas sp. K1W22B-7 TaxID=2303331 RepID=UPI000E33570D|nr:biotin carboxylase N-terminal domain-containing protein [Solimonas sp. K1W22B-7]AXQ30597.1 biotin/lipoyl-binding protein [Solimonas sp. K1W22B-7]
MNKIQYIKRLLVANRGEIARRVMRTASRMGIHTVAVYADGDVNEPFVREADEAWALNGRTAAETYLDVAKVLAAAKASGADAIHPGYGFLSERAHFAQAVIDAGLVWIGPPPEAIAAMGDKLAAKNLMAKIGVPVLHSVELDEKSDLDAAARKVGFPALVKAAAGGGGKGMRIVRGKGELAAAVAGARREAASAFGDPTVFLERYVEGARHVEIQVIGDKHGTLVHCFERECSIQRRHQKVIEEAPSSAVNPELRARMGAAAVRAVQAIAYDNAGTVEFLLDASGEFFFLEINTRLQVEHPVTEAITGVDLVREQIRVAQGEPLSFSQDSLTLTGHAIEARIYAEDPQNDFLPASGDVLAWEMPASPPARFDSGVETGSHVGTLFDPMMAKIIVHRPTRAEAARSLALVLERMRVQGLTTNRDFLVATLRHERFLAGDTTTGFINEVNPPRGRQPDDVELREAAIAAALHTQARNRDEARVLASLPSGFRIGRMPPERLRFTYGEREIVAEYRRQRDGSFRFEVLGQVSSARVMAVQGHALEYVLDGRRTRTTVHRHGRQWWVHGPRGDLTLYLVPRFRDGSEAEDVAGGLTAPMPGQVILVEVKVGDRVAAGQLLAIMEAMKMEHSILAPGAGKVTEVRVTKGDQVGAGDLLVVIEEDAGAEKAA